MNRINLTNGVLKGEKVKRIERCLKDLLNVFRDEQAFLNANASTLVYRVEFHQAEKEGTPGGLFFGTSFVMPGNIGGEYFMTKGHFHKKINRAEYYWGLSGSGWLLLMDIDRNTWYEKVNRGSLHYIPGNVAHRLVNTGSEVMIIGACWPSDAGHDYNGIAEQGFSARVFAGPKGPELVAG